MEIKWLRPDRYIRQKNIEKELKIRLPTKNIAKIRYSINDIYEKIQQNKANFRKEQLKHDFTVVKEQDEENEMSGNASMLLKKETMKDNKVEMDKKFETKKKMYKDYFVFLSQKLDIKICDFSERDETDEEAKKRIDDKEMEEKLKNELNNALKNKGKPQQTKPLPKKDQKDSGANLIEEKIKIRELSIGNIDMSERYNKYSKWVAGLLQIIKDMNIYDINVN